MSLDDRSYMRAQPTGRTVRLDVPPADAIDVTSEPLWAPQRRPMAPNRRSVGADLRRRLASLLVALISIFTLAWAVGCAIIGASLHTEGGTFTPSAQERSTRHGD